MSCSGWRVFLETITAISLWRHRSGRWDNAAFSAAQSNAVFKTMVLFLMSAVLPYNDNHVICMPYEEQQVIWICRPRIRVKSRHILDFYPCFCRLSIVAVFIKPLGIFCLYHVYDLSQFWEHNLEFLLILILIHNSIKINNAMVVKHFDLFTLNQILLQFISWN